MSKSFLLESDFTRSITEERVSLTDELMDKICDIVISELTQGYGLIILMLNCLLFF